MKLPFIFIVIMSAVFCGCQSGLYKVSTSEDDKEIDESVPYYTVGHCDNCFFIDTSVSPDAILYDENRIPVLITEGRTNKVPNKPGWSDVLWICSLGIFPMCQSEYMAQDITVKSPIGEKSGSYLVEAKLWHGWIPILVGFPGSADERDADAKLPNRRLEWVGRERLVKKLVGQFSFKEYVAFAKSENAERKAEIARIKSVSERVNNLLADKNFDVAYKIINNESKWRAGTQECDMKSWEDMRKRVREAHINFVSERVNKLLAKNMFSEAFTLIDNESKWQASREECNKKMWLDMRDRIIAAELVFKRNYVITLVASGRHEDAIVFCNAEKSIPQKVKEGLINDAIGDAVKVVDDPNKLISLLKLVANASMRDKVVGKIVSLNSLSLLSTEELVEIANTSSQDAVIKAIIGAIRDKDTLVSLLDKKRTTEVLKVLLEKIEDADIVRAKIWDIGRGDDELFVYISVFGSDAECMKLIKAYPNFLTDDMLKELKKKASNEEVRLAIYELQVKRLAAEFSNAMSEKGLSYVVSEVGTISDKSTRSKVALQILWELPKHIGRVHYKSDTDEDKRITLKSYSRLIAHMSDEDIDYEIKKIMKACESRIHFEGLYVRMPLQEYFLLKNRNPDFPSLPWSRSLLGWLEYIETDLDKITIERSVRYKLFEKEDGEFWTAYLKKYVPSLKKQKSLSETIGDALDSGTFDYQRGWDNTLEESCYIYKSMKYGTKVVFGTDSGTFVLEEYK